MTPEDIGDIFQALEDALFAMAIRNMKRHENWEEEEGFKWTQWQAEQINSLRAYRQNVAILTNYHFNLAKKAVETFLREAYEGSVDDAAETAARILGSSVVGQYGRGIGLPQRFFGADSRKLDIIINEAIQNIDTKRYAAINRMNFGYTDFLRKADMFAQSGSYTIPQAIDMASKDFLSAGLNCVEYSNGNRVNIASYAEMALRTSSSEVTRQANGDVRNELGEYLVVSNVIGMTCPYCQKWQGKVLIDDVYSDGKPDGEHKLVSEAKADHFLHPNCRHQLYMYIEGITEIADLPNDVETKEHYKAEQEQRRQEREIRKYKRLRDGAVDPANRQRYEARVREWTAKHDQFLQEHDYLRKNPKRLAPGYTGNGRPSMGLRGDDPDLFQIDKDYKRLEITPKTKEDIRQQIYKFSNKMGDISDHYRHVKFEPYKGDRVYGQYFPNSNEVVLKGFEGKGGINHMSDVARANKKNGQWSSPSPFHSVRHELTHAWVDDQKRRMPDVWKIKETKLKELYDSIIEESSRQFEKTGVELNEAFGKKLSIYGMKNLEEFIAEGVAEYLNGSPRAVAKQIYNILNGV